MELTLSPLCPRGASFEFCVRGRRRSFLPALRWEFAPILNPNLAALELLKVTFGRTVTLDFKSDSSAGEPGLPTKVARSANLNDGPAYHRKSRDMRGKAFPCDRV